MGYYNRQNRVLDDLIKKNVKSPFAAQQLAFAQNMFGGRMAGAGALENNIFANNAAFNSNVGRNASSAAEAIALAAGGQQQTDDQLANLQTMEQQNRYQMLQNLNQAYGVNIDEDRNQFQNEVALKGAKAQNELAKRKALWNTVGGIANLGASFLTSGAFNFGKGGKKSDSTSSPSVGVWNGKMNYPGSRVGSVGSTY